MAGFSAQRLPRPNPGQPGLGWGEGRGYGTSRLMGLVGGPGFLAGRCWGSFSVSGGFLHCLACDSYVRRASKDWISLSHSSGPSDTFTLPHCLAPSYRNVFFFNSSSDQIWVHRIVPVKLLFK